jgi:hypothetical protein
MLVLSVTFHIGCRSEESNTLPQIKGKHQCKHGNLDSRCVGLLSFGRNDGRLCRPLSLALDSVLLAPYRQAKMERIVPIHEVFVAGLPKGPDADRSGE